MKVGTPAHVNLWEAINALVVASGGRADATSVARMGAVVAVERAVEMRAAEIAEIDEIAVSKPAHGCRRCIECEGDAHHWMPIPEHDIKRDVVFFECKHCPATCAAIDGPNEYEPSGTVADPPFSSVQHAEDLEQRLHAEVSAWIKRVAPRMNEDLDYAAIKLIVSHPGSDDDGTLCLEYGVEEKTSFGSERLVGRVPGVRP